MILLIISDPVNLNSDVIYVPHLDTTTSEINLSGRNLWLSHLRVVDNATRNLLRDVELELKPLAKSFVLKQGRAKLALKPGVYNLVFSKKNYYEQGRRITVIPESIKIVTIALVKNKEVALKEARQAKLDSLMILGIRFFNQDSLAAAKDIFKEIVAIDSGYDDAHQYIARIEDRVEKIIDIYAQQADDLRKKRQYKEAIGLWKVALAYDTTNQMIKDKIAELEDAMRTASSTSSISKQDIDRYYKQGIKHFSKGEYQQALKLFRTVLKYDPNHSGAKTYLKRTEIRIKSSK